MKRTHSNHENTKGGHSVTTTTITTVGSSKEDSSELYVYWTLNTVITFLEIII